MKRKNSSEEPDFQLDLTKETPMGKRDSLGLPITDPLEYSDDQSYSQIILKQIREQEQAEQIRRIEKMKQSQVSQQSSDSQQSLQSRNTTNSEDKKRERRAIFEKYKKKQEPQPTQQNDKDLLLAFDNIFKRKENVIKRPNDNVNSQKQIPTQIFKSQPPAALPIKTLNVSDASLIVMEGNQHQHLMDTMQQVPLQSGVFVAKDSVESLLAAQFDADNNFMSQMKEGHAVRTVSKISREDSIISGGVSKIYPVERNSSTISVRESHDLEDLLKEDIFNDISRLQDRSILTSSLQLRDSLKIQPTQIQNQNMNFQQLLESSESLKIKQPIEMIMPESSEIKSPLDNEINISNNSDSKDQGNNATSMSMAQTKLPQPPTLDMYKTEIPLRPIEPLFIQPSQQIIVKQVQPLKSPIASTQQEIQSTKITSAVEIPSPTIKPITHTNNLIGSLTPITHIRSETLMPIPAKTKMQETKPLELIQALPQTSICELLREAFRLNSTSANLSHPEVTRLVPAFRRQFISLISELSKATSTLITINQELLQREMNQLDILNNFRPQTFMQGLWATTLSKNINIIKPTQSHQRRVCDHIQIQSKLSETHMILKQLLVIVEEDGKLDLQSVESRKLYVSVKYSLNDILIILFKISEDLYIKAFVAYIPDHYITFYQYLKATLFSSQARDIKSVMKQRQAMKVLVDYMRQRNDPLCASTIGNDIKTKLENELKTLKRNYYQQKQHITLA